MGSRQRQANKAWQCECGPADAARTGRHMKLAGLWSGPMRFWRECGGAGRSENGLGPTLLSPPNLSPLPVFVHTHSLSLQQENLDFPLFFRFFIFFVFFFFFIIPSVPNPPTVLVKLTYPTGLLPTPKILLEGNKEETGGSVSRPNGASE